MAWRWCCGGVHAPLPRFAVDLAFPSAQLRAHHSGGTQPTPSSRRFLMFLFQLFLINLWSISVSAAACERWLPPPPLLHAHARRFCKHPTHSAPHVRCCPCRALLQLFQLVAAVCRDDTIATAVGSFMLLIFVSGSACVARAASHGARACNAACVCGGGGADQHDRLCAQLCRHPALVARGCERQWWWWCRQGGVPGV